MRLRARHVEYAWDAVNGLLLAAVVVVLVGCESPGRVTTGAPVAAPDGYVELCKREPAAPECSR